MGPDGAVIHLLGKFCSIGWIWFFLGQFISVGHFLPKQLAIFGPFMRICFVWGQCSSLRVALNTLKQGFYNLHCYRGQYPYKADIYNTPIQIFVISLQTLHPYKISLFIPSPIHRAIRVCLQKFRALWLGEGMHAVLRRWQLKFWSTAQVSYFGKFDIFVSIFYGGFFQNGKFNGIYVTS